ncbi:MAG TPA: RNA-binding domain-containing protein, partial [Candidatus Saccharimonadales bacterium]|nr:RNA-binding domain-containing protein [Candidatus Saccharimonadales bacterium]
VSPEDIARSVCAFLNSGGGRILIGVEDKSHIVGVQDAAVTARRLQQWLLSLISPRALWTVEPLRVDRKDILIVEVPEGLDKPYVAGGAIYSRIGKDAVPATRDKISVLIQKGARKSRRWERQIATGLGRVDLNQKLIRETLRMAITSRRWQGSSNNTHAFLHGLGLIRDGGVTNAALMLFGKRPSQLFPQARVRLVVMPKGKTGNRYALDKSFDSCLLGIAGEIEATLLSYTGGVESRFSAESWRRDDRQIYPMTALREGVMNALVHRDYSSNASITISIFPDSLQISNPGGLPEGLKPADLKRDHLSLPRNPDIAHACFLRGFIEKVGRGTQRILEDCREAHLPDPKWQS